MVLTPRQEWLQKTRDEMAPGEKPQAIVPHTFAEVITMCQALAAADLAPKALRGKATDMALVIMTGAEVGLPPMASLRLYTTWDGVPRLMAEGMRAIILQSPAVEYFEMATCDDNHATWIGKRRGRPEKSVTWTIERAKRAGLLNKENWQKYPQDMMNARASMQLGRLIAPDVVAGMVALEEARDGDFIDAQAVETPKFVAPPPPTPQGPPPGVPQVAVVRDTPNGPVAVTVTDTGTKPTEQPRRGPGRPPKDKPVEKSQTPGTDPFRAAREAVDAKAAAGNPTTPPAGNGSSGNSSSSPTSTEPSGSPANSPSTSSAAGAATRDRWGQNIGDPTSAGGGPAPQSSEASTSGTPSTASTASAEDLRSVVNTLRGVDADDGFGGEDPQDSEPAPTGDPGLQMIAEFQSFLAGCKTQTEMQQGRAPFAQRSAALFKDGDQRFAAPGNGKPAGELAARMGQLWAERKSQVPV